MWHVDMYRRNHILAFFSPSFCLWFFDYFLPLPLSVYRLKDYFLFCFQVFLLRLWDLEPPKTKT